MLNAERVIAALGALELAFSKLSPEQRALYVEGLAHCNEESIKRAVAYLVKNWSEDRAFPRIAEILTAVRRVEDDLSYASGDDLRPQPRCPHCGGTGFVLSEIKSRSGLAERRAPDSLPMMGGNRKVPWSTTVAHFCQACNKGRAMYEAHLKDRTKKGFIERGAAPAAAKPEEADLPFDNGKEPELPYSEVEEPAAYEHLLPEEDEEDGAAGNSGT